RRRRTRDPRGGDRPDQERARGHGRLRDRPGERHPRREEAPGPPLRHAIALLLVACGGAPGPDGAPADPPPALGALAEARPDPRAEAPRAAEPSADEPPRAAEAP